MTKYFAGVKIGLLTILHTEALHAYCVCECGAFRKVRKSSFLKGVVCCGCTKVRKSNSVKRDPAYEVWRGMRRRCQEENHPSYYRYGGRGITVCDRWLRSFKEFKKDMGERPEGMELDRIDNDGNYCPENCRWVTHAENMKNTSKSRPGKSGISGIYVNRYGAFTAEIGARKTRKYLGSSKDFFEACCLRKSAENKYWNKGKDNELKRPTETANH